MTDTAVHPFVMFPKIARLDSQCTVTEKIDGTNACVIIAGGELVGCQSRKRLITPDDDNYGFATWAHQHASELVELGDGYHYGEWWGEGIQRRYNQTRKRFSLFNVKRWADDRPVCCDVVPILQVGDFMDIDFKQIEYELRTDGSVAAPGFMRPEGFMVYHHRLNAYAKHPFDKPAGPEEHQ